MMAREQLIHVYYMGSAERQLLGRLAYKNRSILFEYDTVFLASGLELSPFKLPLKAGVLRCEDRTFDGLFGVFNDSLPDGWGKLLLDRMLLKKGIKPGDLTPLDRLCYVGKHGMGALAYEPAADSYKLTDHINLDKIADECLQFQESDDDQFVDDLLAMNGSSSGARPKVLVSFINDAMQTTEMTDVNDRHDWIIKFPSSIDPKDIGSIEYAYHQMAQAAGLDVPEARLFKSKRGLGYFGVKRFDRMNIKRVHMHTISGLLHTDHRIPSLDYQELLKVTLWMTKNTKECEKQFRYAVFNVLAHNRDDHAKNFSYLMNDNGMWHVSPAYDLTFSSGPAGEHCTTVMGEGRKPALKHLIKLAEVSGIDKNVAIQMVDEVKSSVDRWRQFADEAMVTKKSRDMIQIAINQVR